MSQSYVTDAMLYELSKMRGERVRIMDSVKYHDLELSRGITRRDRVDAAIEELEDFLKERGTEF